ncbi:MAG: LLM class flavin-dependent oxidoreductase [Bacteroidia bacterium]|nr:LLM class flavin-dependent oxidoreductase [Bacteroidia bacterium]
MVHKNLSHIPLSILDLAMITEGNPVSITFSNSVNLAQHAEKLGYKRYWLAEHHNIEGVGSSATVVLIGHLASQTSTIRIGSGGIMLPNHSPLIVAEQFGTLETLYPGRIDLGLGRAPGTDQLTAIALRRSQKAAAEFPENIQELQQYLSSSNKNAQVRAIPGEGLDIPIWILGSSTDSAYVAASLGLPYAFASHFAPAMLHQALAIYHTHFRPSEILKKPYVMACVSAIAADTDAEAEKLSTSFKRLYLGIITGQREKLKPPTNPSELIIEPALEAALQQMITYSFRGSAETVRKGLNQFIDSTQVDELMMTCPVYEHSARLKSYEIIKKIQQS